MFAGMSNWFGDRIKQLESVGDNGKINVDFFADDTIEARFNKVVFVIRKDLYEYFEKTIGKRIKLR